MEAGYVNGRWMELAHDRVQAEVLGSNTRELVLDFEQCGNAI
jgi:hypothetical protein